MALLCRMCADEADTNVSLFDTSQHHLQWAINSFDITLDDGLPTTVCFPCEAIIRLWTSFLTKREKAISVFSTIAKNQSQLAIIPSPSLSGTERLHPPPVPHIDTSDNAEPSASVTVSDLSLPLHLVTKHHLKDLTIRVSRLSDQMLHTLQQNDTVDCSTIPEQMKLETVVSYATSDEMSDTVQPADSSSEDDDDIEVPFEATHVPLTKFEQDTEDCEPFLDFSAPQTTEIAKTEQIDEVDSDMTLHIAELQCHENMYNQVLNILSGITRQEERSPADAVVQPSEPERTVPSSDGDLTAPAPTETSSFRCKVCNRLYKTRIRLRQHELEVHNSIRPFSCNLCKKTFSTKSVLNLHKIIHSNLRPFKCTKCDSCFNSKANLSRHKYALHNNEQVFKCNLCIKTFKSKIYMNRHIRRHTDERYYKCEQCDGKKFKTMVGLKYHYNVSHSDVRPFECDFCHMTFKTRLNIMSHIYTHVRQFICDKCSTVFKFRCQLKRHLVVCDGEKRDCDVCHRKYKSVSHLQRHVNKKHNSVL